LIENDKDQQWYFSEKLSDAMLTGVIPIMWGTGQYVRQIFDERGIIFWETIEDLQNVLKGLDTMEKVRAEHAKRVDAMVANYYQATKYSKSFFDRFLELLVGPNGTVNSDVCG
jgi:hypothetical protein